MPAGHLQFLAIMLQKAAFAALQQGLAARPAQNQAAGRLQRPETLCVVLQVRQAAWMVMQEQQPAVLQHAFCGSMVWWCQVHQMEPVLMAMAVALQARAAL